MAVWNPKIECAKRSEIEAIQLERLKWSVQHAYDHVPMYHDKMVKAGVKPSDIRTLKDISKIPLTTKTELREQYPFKLLAVPMREVVRIHASSGTTGQPITAGYTRRDLDTWAECIARIATAGGATARRYRADQLRIHPVYRRVRAARRPGEGRVRRCIPISSGNTERQINIMQRFRLHRAHRHPQLCAVHGRGRRSAWAAAQGHPQLRVGLFGGEGQHRARCARSWSARYGILATENYGLTEVMGPGVSGECEYKCGMHINEDCFLAEIIDPDTGEVLPMGEQGELVLTTLDQGGACPSCATARATLPASSTEPCACGRTQLRMEKIKGRSDDMLIIRGVNVFPIADRKRAGGHAGYRSALRDRGHAARISRTSCEVQGGAGATASLLEQIQRAGEAARHAFARKLQHRAAHWMSR